MTTKDEALRQAALSVLDAWDYPQGTPEMHRRMRALRDALDGQRVEDSDGGGHEAQQQGYINSLDPSGQEAMFEQIDLWARKSYLRHRSGVSGQQLSYGDDFQTHVILASLRWAKEHPANQTPQQPAQRIGINGLTEADTNATASVVGLVGKPAQQRQKPVAYIRKDHLQKAVKYPFLCEVTPEPRIDRIGIYTLPPAQQGPIARLQPVDTAPKDGTHILLRGRDGRIATVLHPAEYAGPKEGGAA